MITETLKALEAAEAAHAAALAAADGLTVGMMVRIKSRFTYTSDFYRIEGFDLVDWSNGIGAKKYRYRPILQALTKTGRRSGSPCPFSGGPNNGTLEPVT